MKLVVAKCPSCGGELKLSKDEEKTQCKYCKQTILVDDAIACYKLKISGTVSVEGVASDLDLINAGNELMEMNEFLKAKKKFQEFSERCPNNYQGWLGLMLCRTRKLTIRDNNILFENDVNKYYEHFMKTAPEDVKQEYMYMLTNYMNGHLDGMIQKPKDLDERLSDLQNKKKNISNEIEKILPGPIICLFLALVCLIGTGGSFISIIILVISILSFPKCSEALANNIKSTPEHTRKILYIIFTILYVIALFISSV